jgi:hypothetical protein
MEPFIALQKVRPLLFEIKNQHIQIIFRDGAGKWSEEYGHIEYYGGFSISTDAFVIVVRAPRTDKIYLLDLSLITGIKLNKYINWKGHLYTEFEIFHSKNLEYLKVPFEDL